MAQLKVLLLGFTLFLVGSCASVPKESVALSRELESMINSSRRAHIEMLEYNTQLQLDKVDNFLNEKWIPDFTSSFVKESGILDNIENAPTNEKKGAEILEFAQAALPIIEERRSEMTSVIFQMNNLVKQKIEEHYREMLYVNQALTAHLSSAAEVNDIREQLRDRINIKENLVPVDKMNKILEDLIKSGAKAEKIPDLLQKFKESLN